MVFDAIMLMFSKKISRLEEEGLQVLRNHKIDVCKWLIWPLDLIATFRLFTCEIFDSEQAKSWVQLCLKLGTLLY